MFLIQKYKDLSVAIKIYLLTGFMMAFVLYLLAGHYQNQQEKLDVVEQQRAGVKYLQSIIPLLQNVPVHRGMSNGYLSGNDGIRAKLSKQNDKVFAVMAEHEKLDTKYAKYLNIEGQFDKIVSTWNDLSSANLSLEAKVSFARHTALIEDIIELAKITAFNSKMLLDSNLDSFYLGDMAVNTLPNLTNQMGILRGFGAGYIARGRDLNDSQALSKINGLINSLDAGLVQLIRQYDSASSINSFIESELKASKAAAAKNTQTFFDLAGEVTSSPSFSMASSDYFGVGSKAIGNLFDLYKKALPVLDSVYERRGDELSSQLTNATILSIIILGAIITLAFFIIRTITKPLKNVSHILEEIAQQRFDVDIQSDSQDELGEMTTTLAGMRNQLRDNIEHERAIAATNNRIKEGLDSVSSSVTLLDTSLNIIYLNCSAQELFTNISSDLASSAPGFDASSVINQNWSAFDNISEISSSKINEIQSSLSEQINIGSRKVSVVASPVMDENGTRLGTVVEWHDKTEELEQLAEERRVSAANERIKQALDNVSAGVLVADHNREVIYHNLAAQSLFRNAEAHIQEEIPSFSSTDILGKTVEQNFLNAAEFASNIDALNGSATERQVIGGHTLDITLGSVADENNQRLGTVIELADLTSEVALEKQIDDLVASAASGDLNKRINASTEQGFFKSLGEGLNQLMEINQNFVDEVGDLFKALSNGEMNKTITKEYEGQFAEIKSNANASIQNLKNVILEVRSTADSVNSGASEVSRGNDDLSRRTESQASSLEETASSMEEINATVAQSSNFSSQANVSAEDAMQKAKSGGKAVENAVSAMDEILSSSNKINDIIGVIDEIAFQTNLLALNAAVEAARAGEQGRGFAVVAGEVRTLSQRSAAAAKEIKDLIRDSVAKAETGSELVNKSGETLTEIVSAVEDVLSKISQVNVASKEQASGIAQINQAISTMDSSTQQNAALVEETSAAAKTMSEQANGLARQVSFFKL